MRTLLLLSTALMIPVAGSLADAKVPTYTHTYTPIELRSISQNSNSYKIASVCFLGFGCGDDARFSQGDSTYERDPVEMCLEEGYALTSCSLPTYLSGQCPYHSSYYKACKEDKPRACKDAGYITSCPAGQITDTSCPYDSSYKKCKCNSCDGYAYTYAQATAQGYVTDGSCLSCSTSKYKRKNNPCSGYNNCECGGEIGAATCYSGPAIRYKTCKTCCPYECNLTSCPIGNTCRREACSNKFCITGCAVNYTDWCTQPVTDCGTLGYSKTAADCPDGYLKCPYGETVFCEHKNCAIGDIYYVDNTCGTAATYSGNKIALGVVIYVTDDSKHGQVMSAKNIGRYAWGGYGENSAEISKLNRSSATYALQDFNSCKNTDIIITSPASHPAAAAARKYAPTAETTGKWCLPAAGIVANIYKNMNILNSSIAKLKGEIFTTPGDYDVFDRTWTATPGSYYDVWVLTLDKSLSNTSGLLYHIKDVNVGNSYDYLVRPVLEF